MAIRERAPRTQSPEQKPLLDAASIASHVAGVVDSLQRDRQSIQNPYEVCRRADMAMVAMLEVVSPVFPEIVQTEVQRLIGIHDALYQAASPPIEQQE